MPILVSLLLLLSACFAGAGLLALLDLARGRQHMSCVCSHTLAAHEHFRPGDDCGLCVCPSFLPIWAIRARPLPDQLEVEGCVPDWDWTFQQIVRGEF